jgi:hypothetical protein
VLKHLSAVQVVYGHILGVVFFDDHESLLSLVGTGLLGLGVVTVSLGGGARKQPDQDMLPFSAAAVEEERELHEERETEFAHGGRHDGQGSPPEVSGRSALVPQWSGIDEWVGEEGRGTLAGRSLDLDVPHHWEGSPSSRHGGKGIAPMADM